MRPCRDSTRLKLRVSRGADFDRSFVIKTKFVLCHAGGKYIHSKTLIQTEYKWIYFFDFGKSFSSTWKPIPQNLGD